MINKYIRIVSDNLEITPPPVEVNPEKLRTRTQQALYDREKIYLRSNDFGPDLAFALAHELRHRWQVETDPDFYFADYQELNERNDLTAYNLQPAEIDANAYAMIIMSDLFGIKPLFEGLPEEVKQKIKKRAREIAEME